MNGMSVIVVRGDFESLLSLIGTIGMTQPRFNPMVQECRSKDGRAQHLNGLTSDIAQWQASLEGRTTEMRAQLTAYATLMSNPDLSAIKAKVSCWNAKAEGTLRGIAHSYCPELLKKITDIAGMIIQLDQKAEWTSDDLSAIHAEIRALELLKTETKQKNTEFLSQIKDQAANHASEALQKKLLKALNLTQQDAASEAPCLFCRNIKALADVDQQTSKAVNKFIENADKIFTHCMNGLESSRVPQMPQTESTNSK